MKMVDVSVTTDDLPEGIAGKVRVEFTYRVLPNGQWQEVSFRFPRASERALVPVSESNNEGEGDA